MRLNDTEIVCDALYVDTKYQACLLLIRIYNSVCRVIKFQY